MINLPNYFMADLPREVVLSQEMIKEACQTLKRNRERYLMHRSTQNLIKTLCEVAENWLNKEYPLRQFALKEGPAITGFSRETLAEGLEAFFSQFTPANFQSLLVQDLGHPQRLDGFQATTEETRAERASVARGPELLAHFAGGALPNPPLMSMVLGLLIRSAQFVKCASGQAFIPRMFAHSLYEVEPKLGACLEVAEWKGGTKHLEEELFRDVDCVTATGSDQALGSIRQRLPGDVRLVSYGHKVSFGFIAHELLSGMQRDKVLARAAHDVAAWNQLGCLSPHVFYVESGGGTSAEQFAELLAAQLEQREQSHPRGQLTVQEAAAISSRRDFYQVRATNAAETRLWSSKGSTAWTVIFEADPRFQGSCLNRFIYVKGVSDLEQALEAADSMRGKVSTVGIAAPEHRRENLAARLARWCVTRVCPLGQMQNPPLSWRHDGRPALGDLVMWTDWEL